MDALYQEQILDFAKAARGLAPLSPLSATDKSADISNPVCGDHVAITAAMDGDHVKAIGAKVRGCALCEAGVGLLANIASPHDHNEILALRDALAAWLDGDDHAAIHPEMQKFTPVRAIRNRHKCVLLGFDALVLALN